MAETPPPVSERQPELLLLTGMSGAGRGSMARVLEDLSYRVIDNLPPAMILEVAATDRRLGQTAPLALVIRSWDAAVSPEVAIGRAIKRLGRLRDQLLGGVSGRRRPGVDPSL